MQFYPHQVPLTSVGSATSSSIAMSSSFIANFASIPVYTASLALNISGAAGTNGTNINFAGPKGATGPRGVTGFRGDSVFLLSGSWQNPSVTCNPAVTCYEYSFAYAPGNTSPTDCNFGIITKYYSTSDTLSGGETMYSNPTCTAGTGTQRLGGYGPTNTVAETTASILSFPGLTCLGV